MFDDLLDFLSERASLCETGFTSGRLTQDRVAAVAHNDSLGMAKNGGDEETSGASDVHKETVGTLNESLQFVHVSLLTGRRVSQIFLQISGSGVRRIREFRGNVTIIRTRRLFSLSLSLFLPSYRPI